MARLDTADENPCEGKIVSSAAVLERVGRTVGAPSSWEVR